LATVVLLRGLGAGSLQPSPARSYQQAVVNFAISDWTKSHPYPPFTVASRFENYGWESGASATDIESAISKINGTSNSETMLTVSRSNDLFIGKPQNGGNDECKRECV
jgi:hypothetical protein